MDAETKENPDSIKCNYCGEILDRDPMRNFIFHSYGEHDIKEHDIKEKLDEYSERDIMQNYKIFRSQMVVQYVKNYCKKVIDFAINSVHVLITHLKVMYPDKYNSE